MKSEEKVILDENEIIRGLELAYKKMVAFKRYKNTPLVVSKNGKIVEIPPNEIEESTTYS